MPLGIDFLQIFLHLFNVVLLFGGLYILLYSPVKKFIEEREKSYVKREEETAENLKASEKSKAEYQSRLDSLDDEISEQRKKAAADISNIKRKAEEEARAESTKIIADAQETALRERRKIMMGIKDEIEDMILIATEKVVMGDTQKANFDELLNEAERSMADADR